MQDEENKRAKKWEKKLSGAVRKQRIDAQKSQMDILEKEASEDFEEIEINIKRMVQGCPHLYIPYYIIFAKEIYSKQKKFSGQTLMNELAILDEKWRMRGLDMITLNRIKNFYIPTYPYLNLFKFDLSLLDGPDVLE